ncbi:MAG TPA: 5'/3'-nucleotidase SurE, partial [Spirochaetia bacterium]
GSHSITLADELIVSPRGERRFACRGTPVDCVLVGILGIVQGSIDLILSGINHGPNLGTDILFSGTAAGAREGAILGIPSVALSLGAYAPPFDFTVAAAFAARNLDHFRELGTDDHFLNINFPAHGEESAGTAITFPSRRIYGIRMSQKVAQNGDIRCTLAGPPPGAVDEEGSDYWAVDRGLVSISPVHAQPRNWVSSEESYRRVKFR